MVTQDEIKEELPPRPYDISTEAGRRLYVESIKANPNATRAEKSYADIEERFNFKTDDLTREQVEQAFTAEELERMAKGDEFVQARAYNQQQREVFDQAVQKAQDKGILDKQTGQIDVTKAVERGMTYDELAPLGVTPDLWEQAKAFKGIETREKQRVSSEQAREKEFKARLQAQAAIPKAEEKPPAAAPPPIKKSEVTGYKFSRLPEVLPDEPDMAIWEHNLTHKKITTDELNKLSGQDQDAYFISRDAAADFGRSLISDPRRAAIFATGVLTKATPGPVDDLAYYGTIAILGIASGAVIVSAAKMIEEYRKEHGANPPARNIVVTNTSNEATALKDLLRDVNLEQVLPSSVKAKDVTHEQLIPGRTGRTTLAELVPPRVITQLQDGIKRNDIKNLVMINPGGSPESITGTVGGVIEARAAVETAKDKLPAAIQKTVEYIATGAQNDRQAATAALQKAQNDRRAATAALQKAQDARRQVVSGIAFDLALKRFFNTQQWQQVVKSLERHNVAQDDYLTRLAIYTDAKKTLVASLNPEPLKAGRINTEAVSAAYLAQLFNIPADNVKGLDDVLTERKIESLYEYYARTYDKEKENGATDTQAITKARQALKSAVQSALDTKTATRTATRIRTATATATTAGIPATTTATTTDTPSGAATRTPPKPPPRPRSDAPNKKKLAYIKAVGGAITYRDGMLNGKPKWKTWVPPNWSTDDEIVTYGTAPQGAVVASGKGSAKRTAQRIRGKTLPNVTIIDDRGAIDAKITAHNNSVSIDFIPDAIGGKRPSISNKRARISPKMPRLR